MFLNHNAKKLFQYDFQIIEIDCAHHYQIREHFERLCDLG